MWYQNGNKFKEENGYEINGQWYPRVTKILEVKSKPALEIFFKEMDSYALAEDVKNKSAVQGSLVHETIGKLLLGETVEVADEVKAAVEAFQEFNASRQIVFHPEFIERRVWSPRHRYAGTVDALASVDGKFGVLDIKTSAGFYPEYNLQTAAYISALQEFETKRNMKLPQDVQTRWILRIDQRRLCCQCGASLREKGGRRKIRLPRRRNAGVSTCSEAEHQWGEAKGDVELREFPYVYNDIKAFVAAKILWEWEHGYWLRQIGYLR